MKEHGVKVYLATNPIFPRVGTMNRIRWAGIDAEDFEVITTYETYHYCKPNPKYFQEVMEEFGLNPKECLMVGNDVQEDLTIRSLGVKTYLLTDTLENKKNIPLGCYRGKLKGLFEAEISKKHIIILSRYGWKSVKKLFLDTSFLLHAILNYTNCYM